MAKPLRYTPTPVPTDTAHDDLQRLLETLHERGVLRLLTNLSAQSHDVAEVALKQINTPNGRDAFANLAVIVKALGKVDPEALEKLLTGVDKGVQAAVETLEDSSEPKGAFALMGKLYDPDVRRGFDALLTLVQTLGQHLGDPRPKS